MGIKLLNSFLKRNCCKSIQKIDLSELRDKTVVIDASIYLYKYHGNNELIEGIYQMILVFKKFNIIPIYVFDGRPPVEKMDTIKKRKQLRDVAVQQLNLIIDTKVNYNTIRALEKKTTRISRKNVDEVKELLSLSGVSFYQADGEADELCVKLVKDNVAWACISEDMDMFVHGCPRVLRGFNIFNDYITLYSLTNMLNSLRMSFQDFREVCILSGTDYCNTNISFNTAIKFYKIFSEKKETTFREWLKKEKQIELKTELFE